QQVILDGKTITLQLTLRESINELDAVTISAGAFTASDQNRRTVFKALDIATTAGATADIAGALNTLPGTQKVGESGRLFVRGGDGNETRTFIDGMVVLDAYGPAAPNTPSRGRFLPFMFKGTSFSTGGYSAEYGQALSSALALESKDEDQTTRTDIGLLSVGADVAHTQALKNGSVAGKIQYTNIRPYFGLINQEIDWINPPASLETSAAYRQKMGDKGLFKFYGNANHSNFSLYQHDIANPEIKTPLELTNNYRYGNASYQQTFDNGWYVRSGVSYTFNENRNELASSSFYEREHGVHLKTVAEKSFSDRFELKTGVEFFDRNYSAAWTQEQTGKLDQNFVEPLLASFAEADVYASKKFVTRAGVRAEYNALNAKVGVDPRLSLAYKVGEGQFSLAYGRFRQSPNNIWLRTDTRLASEKAEHYILNYQVIRDNRTFRAELYYKNYFDLVKFQVPSVLVPNAFAPSTQSLLNIGNGFAKGLELFWRDNRSLKNVDYWVSYSYLDTERDYLNFPVSAVPSFASKHNFSVVYKHFITKLKSQVGLTYSYASGRPYHDPNQEVFQSGKTPSYQDLSVNVSYLPTSRIIVHLSCTNVLGRDNIFGYQFASTPNADGVYASRAVRQAAPRFLFLGVFITLSKNKSVNQLPSL
ncbi:MAG: TonB-dependent receptor plug domain-containing protein, partial [Cyclobacteriaceae bacterium]|nr:TonB-dependent receptor plug domain-containing protein [Cyclobacteriaceae bacterium]